MRNQSQYKITTANISSERLGENIIDVKSCILEIVLFESLDKPYVSGLIAIQDANGIFDGISFQGTERLEIVLKTENDRLAPVINRSFILSGIEKQEKSSDSGRSSLYVFTLQEEHVFLSMAKKISKTVKGNFENEIVKILNSDLNKTVDLSYSTSSIQRNINAIIPYKHPLEACDWLKERITTESGSPFFLYASIHDNNIRLGNLDVMLSQTAFNTKRPYIYSPTNVQITEDTGSEIKRNFQIISMNTEKLSNTYKLMNAGSIGCLYNNTNLNTGEISSTHISLRDTLNNMKSNNIIKGTQFVFDENFKLNDVLFDEFNSRIIHTITSSGTYYTEKSYHDEYDPNLFKKKVERMSILNSLYKNQFEITVPGVGFIISKVSVGDIVRLMVLGDNNVTTNSDEMLDKNKSGDFLILNTRHTFKDGQHDVVLRIGKIIR